LSPDASRLLAKSASLPNRLGFGVGLAANLYPSWTSFFFFPLVTSKTSYAYLGALIKLLTLSSKTASRNPSCLDGYFLLKSNSYPHFYQILNLETSYRIAEK